MKSIITFIVVCWVSVFATAQTVINYQTWKPSNPSCNLFGTSTAVPATVNSITTTLAHLTNIGQPMYDGSSKSVDLSCSYTTTGSISSDDDFLFSTFA